MTVIRFTGRLEPNGVTVVLTPDEASGIINVLADGTVLANAIHLLNEPGSAENEDEVDQSPPVRADFQGQQLEITAPLNFAALSCIRSAFSEQLTLWQSRFNEFKSEELVHFDKERSLTHAWEQLLPVVAATWSFERAVHAARCVEVVAQFEAAATTLDATPLDQAAHGLLFLLVRHQQLAELVSFCMEGSMEPCSQRSELAQKTEAGAPDRLLYIEQAARRLTEHLEAVRQMVLAKPGVSSQAALSAINTVTTSVGHVLGAATGEHLTPPVLGEISKLRRVAMHLRHTSGVVPV